jgi:hypothetical protein
MKKCKCCDSEFQPSRTTQQVCSPRCALELLQLKKDQKKKEEKGNQGAEEEAQD